MAQILSAMQWSAVKGIAAYDMRTPYMADPFMEIWATAFWDLENLALFNQAAYQNVVSRGRRSDAIVAEHRQVQAFPVVDDDDYERQQRRLALMREAVSVNDIEADAISRYADEVTVVASWAFVEKQLNKALIALQTKLGLPLSTDHRWPVIEAAYQQCGITLSQISGFADADECRKVNNAIKHAGVVTAGLASLPAFSGKAGEQFSKLDLDVQRYYFGAGDFASAALEECSKIVEALS